MRQNVSIDPQSNVDPAALDSTVPSDSSEKNLPDEALVRVNVTFRNTETTEALKEYATQKINNALNKYVVSETTAQVILSVQKRDHAAEVRVNSKRYEVVAQAVTGDLYSAIDKVVDNLTRQIKKQKDRIVNHKS